MNSAPMQLNDQQKEFSKAIAALIGEVSKTMSTIDIMVGLNLATLGFSAEIKRKSEADKSKN